MRPGNQNNKQRMRGRGSSNSSSSSGGGRKTPNTLTRSFESNGPDVKIRGTALHIAEKYQQLARDAHVSGDRIISENYYQHAEHYQRIVAAAQPQPMPSSAPSSRADDDEGLGSVEAQSGALMNEEQEVVAAPQPVMGLDAPQPFIGSAPADEVNDRARQAPPAVADDDDDDSRRRRVRGTRGRGVRRPADEAPVRTRAPARARAPARSPAPVAANAPAPVQANAPAPVAASAPAPAHVPAPANAPAPVAASAPAPAHVPAPASAPAPAHVPDQARTAAPVSAPVHVPTPASTPAPAEPSVAKEGGEEEAVPKTRRTPRARTPRAARTQRSRAPRVPAQEAPAGDAPAPAPAALETTGDGES